MAHGTHAEQQQAEDIENGRKALNDAQQAFSRTFRLWGLVLILVTAVTAVIDASGAAGSMGEFYPAFLRFSSKSLLEIMLKLVECALTSGSPGQG